MKRCLHIVGSMSPSGIGNFIMNIYRHMDREQVQFDFVVHEKRAVSFDEEIEQLGGHLYYVTRKSESLWKNLNEIRQVVKKGQYDVVFRHTDTATVALDLVAAWLGGAKRRIPHSHSTSTPNLKMHQLFQPLLNLIATERFACSEEAGKWLYGKKPYEVIWNGIDIPLFTFSESKRDRIRTELGISDKKVIGHVGNFMPVKNHEFMLEVFRKLHQQNPDTVLMLVGDGELRESITEKIAAYQLQDSVIFTGVRNDTDALLQGMDLFFFPSHYEGMPIALVEAQAAGLPCLVSDVITDDVIVTNRVQKRNLGDSPESWAETAGQLLQQTDRPDTSPQIREGGFDVMDLAHRYERI